MYFLIGVIFSIIINVNFMEKKVEQQVGVTIFFNEGLSQEQIDDIENNCQIPCKEL